MSNPQPNPQEGSMNTQIDDLLHSAPAVDVTAILDKIAEEARALLAALPGERSGLRDGDGTWHGSNPIEGRIENLRKLHVDLEEGNAHSRRFIRDEREIEVRLAGDRTAWVSFDEENGVARLCARTPDARNDFTSDDWCRIDTAVDEAVEPWNKDWWDDSPKTRRVAYPGNMGRCS